MTYPKQMDDSDDDIPGRLGRKGVGQAKKNWLKTQDPDVMGSSLENASQSVTPTARYKLCKMGSLSVSLCLNYRSGIVILYPEMSYG